MAKLPVIKRVEVKKSLLGKIEIKFECPCCHGNLSCQREEIGKPDKCPNCDQQFMVSDAVERRLQAEENSKLEAKLQSDQQKSDAQQAKEAERERKKEEARQRREKKRLEAVSEAEGFEDEPEGQVETQTYANLGRVARWFYIMAWGILGGAIFTAMGFILVNLFADESMQFGVVECTGIVFIEIVVGVFWYVVLSGISESIRLAINVAIDIRHMRNATDA